MKTTTLLAAALTLGSNLCAQFYAPDTEFHDRSQRVYPVEAARVLAFQHNAAGAKIASISYEVTTTPEGETAWTVHWLDAKKKPLREKTVRYPQSLLTEGPQFFREVLGQLTADDWTIASAPADGAAAAFWKAAEGAGLSRLEALTNAARTLAAKPKLSAPMDAAKLAGLLAQGAVPAISTAYTIDGVMLARAAAWLATAEAGSREKMDAPWCPLLFLAGREPAAAKLWSAQSPKAPEHPTAPERMWDFLLRPHRATEAFLFAAAPENQTVAMPVIAYASNMDKLWSRLAAEVSGDLLGDPALARLHEYMVSFAMRGGVGGGHFAGQAPGQFLAAWEETLKAFVPAPLDDAAWRAPFSAAAKARPARGEPATAALQRLAPVLNLGLAQRGAALIPTGAITVADLLGYGWEMAARQFGAQHGFLADMLGDPAAAREVATAALGALRGCDLFLTNPKVAPKEPLTDFLRLELTNAPAAHEHLAKNLPPAWQQPPDRFQRRTWLWGGSERDALEQMIRSGAPDSVTQSILDRLLTEGGANALWQLPLSLKKYQYPAAIDRLGLRPRVAAAVPWAINPQVILAYEELAQKGKSFEYGRRLEELCWQNLTAVQEAEIFCRYIGAHAYAAAKRFYDAIVPFVTDTVSFSNGAAPARFIFAWWENEDAAMRRAMADGATYSWRDLATQMTYALHHDDLAGAGKLVDAIVERYGDERGTLAKLRAWLPLLPALKDPKHPDHEKAISTFATDGYWQSTQFMLARDAKLSTDEAVRFFAGLQDSPWGKMTIAYLQRDKAAFEQSYSGGGAEGNNASAILAELMRNDLLETPSRTNVPDLKPADARPLSVQLVELHGQRESPEVAAALDLSKYPTADQLWKYLEELRKEPTVQPKSREEFLTLVKGWFGRQKAAAAAFMERYPRDPRRYSAQMTSIQADMQLSRIPGAASGAKTDAEEVRRQIDAIIAAADAPEDAKGEATFARTLMLTDRIEPEKPETSTAFVNGAEEFLAKFPTHKLAPKMRQAQLQIASNFQTPEAEAVLKKIASGSDAQVAAAAAQILTQREKSRELKTKPVDLKFTATDGKEVNLAKLRGKVVLVDFWASWCGPCIGEMPNVVATYQKLHGKGFEIVGISLDQEQAAMEGALKKQGMTWPQYFDGKGWQNSISMTFGIKSIPAAWLIDKKGMLRETDLRGDALGAGVEKLLAE